MIIDKKNKGEWSELYVLLKLIYQPILYLANDELEIDGVSTIPVKKILHFEDDPTAPAEYIPLQGESFTLLRKDFKGEASFIVDRRILKKHVNELLDKIANQQGGSRTFAIPEAAAYMSYIGCKAIKAASSKKADISLEIVDRGQMHANVGYSIKSMIGGLSTLFNASKHSNIVYTVSSYKGNIDDVNLINDKSGKYQKRIKKLFDFGGELKYLKTSREFEHNLRYIDTNFSHILATMVVNYFMGKGSHMRDVVKVYCKETGEDPDWITHKIKQFLVYAALGMTPGKVWDGSRRADGGYLIVKEEGELACYQAYDHDKFASYLFNNTKFDTPSGDSRHKFAKLYKDENGLCLLLNFQIRFIK